LEKLFKRLARALGNVEKIEELNEKIRLLFEKTIEPNQQPEDADTNKLAKIFLSTINNVTNQTGRPNFNVSLFQIDSDNTSLNNAKWNKIILDSTQPNGIRKEPCN